MTYFWISSFHRCAHFYNRNCVVIHPFKLIKLDSSDAARRSDDNCINTAKHNSTLSVSSAVHFNLNPELLWRDRVFRRPLIFIWNISSNLTIYQGPTCKTAVGDVLLMNRLHNRRSQMLGLIFDMLQVCAPSEPGHCWSNSWFLDKSLLGGMDASSPSYSRK